MDYRDYFKHYGVLGMHWGVRKDGSPRRSAPSEDYTYSRELKKKSRKSLSNKELKALSERLNLEQQYDKLNPNLIEKGKREAKASLVGKILIGAVTAVITQQIAEAIKNSFKSN